MIRLCPPVRNMTIKDNPGTLPINLYAADSLTVEPLARFHSAERSSSRAVPPPHR